MQFKGESRCCARRHNYATAVNTEFNMTTSASRSGTGKSEPHAERGESGTFRRISVWNASCSGLLSNHARKIRRNRMTKEEHKK